MNSNELPSNLKTPINFNGTSLEFFGLWIRGIIDHLPYFISSSFVLHKITSKLVILLYTSLEVYINYEIDSK